MLKFTTLLSLSFLLALAAVTVARSGRGLRCYYACKRPNSPPDCYCDKKRDCTTKVCGEMESCQMYLGRVPQCVKYRAACDLEKSLVACDQQSMVYYFDKEKMQCNRVPTGLCTDNANSFPSRRQCSQVCYVRQDMDELRGGHKQWGINDFMSGANRKRGGIFRSTFSS